MASEVGGNSLRRASKHVTAGVRQPRATGSGKCGYGKEQNQEGASRRIGKSQCSNVKWPGEGRTKKHQSHSYISAVNSQNEGSQRVIRCLKTLLLILVCLFRSLMLLKCPMHG
jgi:hypothetical protein